MYSMHTDEAFKAYLDFLASVNFIQRWLGVEF